MLCHGILCICNGIADFLFETYNINTREGSTMEIEYFCFRTRNGLRQHINIDHKILTTKIYKSISEDLIQHSHPVLDLPQGTFRSNIANELSSCPHLNFLFCFSGFKKPAISAPKMDFPRIFDEVGYLKEFTFWCRLRGILGHNSVNVEL